MLFTPAVEDAHGPHTSGAAAVGTDMQDEDQVVVALARARKLYLLHGDAASAYDQLRPFLRVDAGGGGLRFHRRELEDTAVELLLALEDGLELEAWVNAAPEMNTGQRQRNHKESLFSLDASAKEFSALNSAELGQRVAVFRLLARNSYDCGASSQPSKGLAADAPKQRMLHLAALLECMTALTRKPHRRDIFLWKHLACVLREKNTCSTAVTSTAAQQQGSVSDVVAEELSAYVSDGIVRCLVFRDRPLESAARTYGAHRTEFERSCLDAMTCKNDCVRRMWAEWLEGADDATHRIAPLILDAARVLRASGCAATVAPMSNIGGSGSSRPSTPRNTEDAVQECAPELGREGARGSGAAVTADAEASSHSPSHHNNHDGVIVLGGAAVVPQEFAHFLTAHLLQWLGVGALFPDPPTTRGEEVCSPSAHTRQAAAPDECSGASQPIEALMRRIVPHYQQLVDALHPQPQPSSTAPSSLPCTHRWLLVLYFVVYSFFFSIFTSSTIAAVYGQQQQHTAVSIT